MFDFQILRTSEKCFTEKAAIWLGLLLAVTVYANLNRLFTFVSYFPVAIVIWTNAVAAENVVSFSLMLATLLDLMFWVVPV